LAGFSLRNFLVEAGFAAWRGPGHPSPLLFFLLFTRAVPLLSLYDFPDSSPVFPPSLICFVTTSADASPLHPQLGAGVSPLHLAIFWYGFLLGLLLFGWRTFIVDAPTLNPSSLPFASPQSCPHAPSPDGDLVPRKMVPWYIVCFVFFSSSFVSQTVF